MNHMQREWFGEKEVSLTDMFWAILRSWRQIVICVILTEIAVIGIKYVRNVESYNVIDEDDFELSSEELEKIENARILQEELNNEKQTIEEYLNNSILMEINAINKPVISMCYVVSDGDDLNYATVLGNTYISYIQNGGINSEIQQSLEWDLEERYIGELLTAYLQGESYSDNADFATNSTCVFLVNVTGTDSEQIAIVADALNEVLQKYSVELEEQFGEHELILVDRYETTILDRTLNTEQIAIENMLLNVDKQLADLTESFSEEQLAVWNGSEDEELSEQIFAQTSVSFISVSMMILGLVLGVLLGSFLVVFKYFFDNKIKSAEELQNVYGLRVFGNLLLKKNGKKKFLSIVDNWIEKLQKNKKISSKTILFTSMLTCCKKKGVDKVIVASSLSTEQLETEELNELLNMLKVSEIEAEFIDNVTKNVDIFEKMMTISNMILVERVGVTEYLPLEKELILCTENQVEVMGIVLLE